jgi:hypothetical protein
MKTQFVFCEVGAEFLSIIQIKFMLQRVNLDKCGSSSSVSSRCLQGQREPNINAVECQGNGSILLFRKLNPSGQGRKQHSETELSRLILTEHLSGKTTEIHSQESRSLILD